MKRHYSPGLLLLLFSYSFAANAQSIPSGLPDENNIPVISENNAENPCITGQEYALIERRCAVNKERFGIRDATNRIMTTALQWPLRAAANLADCSYYHIAAYVDQNTTAGVFQDFNCGTNTYDGHRGTDIATWPFNFYKMDNNLVEVIAAASGTIIDKHDGEFDRNCSSNNLTANYVIIQHADGSVALYWHMKNGSITGVPIGQSVAAGDYLGVVGSSGSASGPHLHFEVWSGNTAATRVDPYTGSCNTLNASSWWASQKSYKETAVIKASVHTTDIVVPPCPATETLNQSTSFQIPFQGAGLSPGYAKFYIFIRDEVNGLTANLSILNPNGTPYLSWNYTSTSDNKVRTWGWSKILPVTAGTYTFQAVYNGITCSSTFNIINPTGIAAVDPLQAVRIIPNPSGGKFFLESGDSRNRELEIYNLLGEKVFQSELTGVKTEINLQVPGGVYFYQVSNTNQVRTAGKLIIR